MGTTISWWPQTDLVGLLEPTPSRIRVLRQLPKFSLLRSLTHMAPRKFYKQTKDENLSTNSLSLFVLLMVWILCEHPPFALRAMEWRRDSIALWWIISPKLNTRPRTGIKDSHSLSRPITGWNTEHWECLPIVLTMDGIKNGFWKSSGRPS